MPDTARLAAQLLAVLAGGLLLAAPLGALPRGVEARFKAAASALARGDGIAAEAELDRALEAGAARSDVAAAMGEALIAQGELVRAREWLAPGQFAPASQAYGWRMIGLLERREGNLPAAGKAYDRALALTPNDPQLWVEIGRMRYAGGEHLQAIQAADRALELGPQHPRALEFRAQLLRDAGDPAGALALIGRALDVAPDDAELLAGQAETLGELGRASEMLTVVRRMAELQPRHPWPAYLQAVLAARAGKTDLARSILGRAGDRLDKVPAAMLLAGLLELEAGNASVAADQLEELARLQPGNQRAQLLLARALFDAGEHGRLFARFGAVAARSDAPAYLLELLGRAHEERGERAAAAPLLDRAASSAPRQMVPMAVQATASAPVTAARSLLAAGNSAQARQVAERQLSVRPGSYEALYLAGDVDLAAGQAARALPRYQAASLARFPDSLLLRISLAYEQLGQAGNSRLLVARYLAAMPQSPLAARMAAGQGAFARDWDSARALLENLRRRGVNRDVRLLSDLSLAQLRSGDGAAASESAARAWALQPANPVAVQAYAMALAETGKDAVLARQLLDQARSSGAGNPLLDETAKKLRLR